MHSLQAPLNELLKKKKNGSECQETFEKIKEVLTSDLFITHYNPDLEIIVASDTSSHGIRTCILHKMEGGFLKPIAHASRTLLPAEKKKLCSDWERSTGNYFCSYPIPLIHPWKTFYFEDRPYTTTSDLWFKKGLINSYCKQAAKMGDYSP